MTSLLKANGKFWFRMSILFHVQWLHQHRIVFILVFPETSAAELTLARKAGCRSWRFSGYFRKLDLLRLNDDFKLFLRGLFSISDEGLDVVSQRVPELGAYSQFVIYAQREG